MTGADFAAKRTLRLTTRGRRSGAPRTVVIWFVATGPRSILVQHTTSAPAYWYRNLLAHPTVAIDFGAGPIDAQARPIDDPRRVQEVLELIRRKYWSARFIQWLGRKATPLAAEISW